MAGGAWTVPPSVRSMWKCSISPTLKLTPGLESFVVLMLAVLPGA